MRLDYATMPLGTIVATRAWGNRFKRFEDGWSPASGATWDRWTVYSDAEMNEFFQYCNADHQDRSTE